MFLLTVVLELLRFFPNILNAVLWVSKKVGKDEMKRIRLFISENEKVRHIATKIPLTLLL